MGNSCVQGVSHALHSPLMAMTNAISGMTIVGGMLQMGGGLLPGTVPQVKNIRSTIIEVNPSKYRTSSHIIDACSNANS